jgi:hypothetical protein
MSKQNKAGKDVATKTTSKAAVKTAAEALAEHRANQAAQAPVEPDVLPPGVGAQGRMELTKRPDDFSALERLEASIQRDIQLSGRLDKAGAMVGIKIGLALQAAKALLRHGEYEGWVASRFGDAFSERRAQYYAKLAASFMRSAEGGQLAMPLPREAGNWLVVADEGSALQKSVEAFVGDMTIGELLDKHGVRPAKAKGGWRPAEWLVAQYQGENPHLANKVFDVWPKEDQEKFREWQAKQVDGDDAAARRMAAEGAWHGIRAQLSDHGIARKSFALLPAEQLEQTRDIVALVMKELNKALKGKEA